jgi:hypothetical protein
MQVALERWRPRCRIAAPSRRTRERANGSTFRFVARGCRSADRVYARSAQTESCERDSCRSRQRMRPSSTTS